MEVTVCRGNELYVTSHGGEPITVNRVEHHGWLRLQHTGNAWELAPKVNGGSQASYGLLRSHSSSYRSFFASASAVQKFLAEVKRAVTEYHQSHAAQLRDLLREGELVYLNNLAFREEDEVEKLITKLAAARAKIATLTHAIDAAGGQQYPSSTNTVG